MNKPSIKFVQKYDNIPKTNVRSGGGQPLLNKGFTLIELLAVLVILAIIALIATPIVLNLINDSKEKSVKISVQNYLRAVEVAVMNKDTDMEVKNLNGAYKIQDNGKKIESENNIINIEYDGQGLIGGYVIIEDYKVTALDSKMDKWTITFFNDEIGLNNNTKTSVLIEGKKLNEKIKNLVNNRTDFKYDSTDEKIISIEFYSNGILPSGYTEEMLKQNFIDVSKNQDNSIKAYNNNGKVIIYSDNLISFNEDSSYMFYRFRSTTEIIFRNITTSNCENMSQMFYSCFNLIELDVSNFDTSNVRDMNYMFYGCKKLKELELGNFNTSNVTNMSGMFRDFNTIAGLDLSGFDTSKVEDMDNMFRDSSLLENLDLSSFNTGNVRDMNLMFYGCTKLKQLNISNFNTSKVTDMSQMFVNCGSLTSLDLSSFNTSNVTNMSSMFAGCSSLTSLDLSNFDTSNVTSMSRMFYWSKYLKPIYVGEKWQIPEDNTSMFTSCATKNEEQLCEPGSTEEWCILPMS